MKYTAKVPHFREPYFSDFSSWKFSTKSLISADKVRLCLYWPTHSRFALR